MIDRLYYDLNAYFCDLTYVLQWHWNNMTPGKYAAILIMISVFGWILMKNGVRQY